MATGTLAPSPWFTALDSTGVTISGALIQTYLAGTTTAATTYNNVDLDPSHANANPVQCDSAGRCVMYLTPGTSYKFVYMTAASVVLRTQDNITAVPSASGNVDVTGTAGEAITAGNAVYLSDGSGGLTAGRWYKGSSTNAYSSTLPEVGFAVADIASAASGTIRQGGTVTGLSGLSTGSGYFLSTAGGLTTTPPANARFVGVADSTTSLVTGTPRVPMVDVGICEGRLTLTTAVPVTMADVTGATSIFWTPYKGNRIALFDGTNWYVRSFTELTLALGTLTSGLPYDVFVYDNAGTLTLEALAWTNGTTRATALVNQDGIPCKTGALTRRYLGTFYTTSTTQTEDSAAKRNLWNYYNRVSRDFVKSDATASWAYGTATIRQARAQTANQVEFVIGVAETKVEASYSCVVGNDNASLQPHQVGLGLNVTNAFSNYQQGNTVVPGPTATEQLTATAHGVFTPAVGYSFLAMLEKGSGTGTTTWYGTATYLGSATLIGTIAN